MDNRPLWKRRVVWFVVAVGLVAVVQVLPVGGDLTNPPVVETPPWPSARAQEIATRSCAACHSNSTDWPWYAQVAPMSWLVVRDVEEGRDDMNFSTWDRDEGEADDAIETILDGSMPPLRYVLMHPSARLSEEEKQILVDAFGAMDD